MNNSVDITRWSRKDRREVKKNSGHTIPGRNLPYVKRIHGPLDNFNTLRAKEIEQENAHTQTEETS